MFCCLNPDFFVKFPPSCCFFQPIFRSWEPQKLKLTKSHLKVPISSSRPNNTQKNVGKYTLW
jgi:hypothetical protein